MCVCVCRVQRCSGSNLRGRFHCEFAHLHHVPQICISSVLVGSTEFNRTRGRSRMNMGPRIFYNAGTEHVEFSPTRQALLAPSAKRMVRCSTSRTMGGLQPTLRTACGPGLLSVIQSHSRSSDYPISLPSGVFFVPRFRGSHLPPGHGMGGLLRCVNKQFSSPDLSEV